MKKLLLALMFGILLINFISAVDPELTFKQDEIINLNIPCYINGAYCDNSFNCFLTVEYPKTSQVFINNMQMTRNPSYYNYTLNNSNIIGIYPSHMQCSNGTLNGKTDFEFEITPTGDKLGTFDAILYIGILILLIALFILALTRLFTSMFSIGWFMFSASVSYLLLIGIIFMAGKMVNDFIPTLPAIGQFFDMALIILIVGLFPLIIFFIGYIFYGMFKEKEIKSMTDMGYDRAEAIRLTKK